MSAGASGRKDLKKGSLPTRNLPVKSFDVELGNPMRKPPSSRPSPPLPERLLYKNFENVRSKVKNHLISDWSKTLCHV